MTAKMAAMAFDDSWSVTDDSSAIPSPADALGHQPQPHGYPQVCKFLHNVKMLARESLHEQNRFRFLFELGRLLVHAIEVTCFLNTSYAPLCSLGFRSPEPLGQLVIASL